MADHQAIQRAIEEADDAELIGYFLTAVTAIGIRVEHGQGQDFWATALAREYRRQGDAPLTAGLVAVNVAWQLY